MTSAHRFARGMAQGAQGLPREGEGVHQSPRKTSRASVASCRGSASTRAYAFDGPEGRVTLADLFGGLSQLVVYHFMFGPDWKEGCPSCSFWADNYNGIDVHLAHRDTALVAISRGALDRASKPTGSAWAGRFRWVSSAGSDFNFDFGVSFVRRRRRRRRNYNFGIDQVRRRGDAPGFSAFRRGDDGAIYHTYSTYGARPRLLNGTYQMLDLTSKGRDESGLPYPMAWVKRHDRY